ncbi:hypothetical protein F0562_035346 [Nyssa sinensis]|uniref:CRIB domain-containing protein n=1 Tax=Nyssa sinensis TaxID=561372 RepID=A0A5J5A9Q8_9ASTE|nr:hypothetical protein F0562_035346 [Nyssa sinensis]
MGKAQNKLAMRGDGEREGVVEDRAMDISLKDLSQKLEEFAKARDWEKYHSPRNLLLAMVGEVGELIRDISMERRGGQRAYQIGRSQIRSIWEKNCLMCSYTLSGWLIFAALILVMLPPKRLLRMQSNTQPRGWNLNILPIHRDSTTCSVLLQAEVETKTAKSSSSCTNGLLWLTRAMDFLVELFRNFLQHQDWSMSQACTDSYGKTLKKWHGWLASSSFTVAIKLAPDRKKFMEVIGGAGDINADMENFCTNFSPLLQEIHKFLASVGLDDNEKEPEMQIGHPTDVKHVAHIGSDGPSANQPSWLNEFKTTSEPSPGMLRNVGVVNPATESSAKEDSSMLGDITEMQNSLGAFLNSSTRNSASKTKQSKRHHSSNGSEGSPARDSTSSTKPRRQKNSRPNSPSRDSSNQSRGHQNSNLGSDPPAQDMPPMLKQSRQKKSKDSSHSGSMRSSRSKAQDPLNKTSPFSDFGSGQGPEKNETCPSSVLEGFPKRNECDEISRGIHAL